MILGPIVGHTDAESSRVWIRVNDDPTSYTLRLPTVGTFPFVSTELTVELGTAVAIATGLRPDRAYRYHILRNGVQIGGSTASLRTMPRDRDRRGVSFTQISCNSNTEIGCWPDLLKYVRSGIPPEKRSNLRIEVPRFLLMLGDQVYLDQNPGSGNGDSNVWDDYFSSSPLERRAAIAEWYQQSWGRKELREVMANIPTYMMWDDHDIRNGWGSLAHDSPTITEESPGSSHLYVKYNEIFEDCRYVYWHFQRSHGPALGSLMPPMKGERKGLPSLFRVGRMLVLMLDTRGERDIFRDKDKRPALGEDQWAFIEETLADIPSDVDYLVIATAAPIAHYSKNAIAQQRVVGYPAQTTYDVDAFNAGVFIKGNGNAKAEEDPDDYPIQGIRRSFMEVRDQWPHHNIRKEQKELIELASKARFSNRGGDSERSLVFVAGDVHFGGNYKVTVSSSITDHKKTDFRCFFSSGIGKKISDDDIELVKGGSSVKHRFRTKRNFKVAKGIWSKIKVSEWRMNIGIIQTSASGMNNFRHSHQSTKSYSKTPSVERKQKRL